MDPFRSIELEGRAYPSVIMGEDRFTGWFTKSDPYPDEDARAAAYRAALDAAYEHGVRGFSMNPHETLMRVLRSFVDERDDATCIANHHYRSHYYVGEESLWSAKNLPRLGASEAARLDPTIVQRSAWYGGEAHEPFSDAEIAAFRLDEKEYAERLEAFSFCRFVLLGNIGNTSLITLDHSDLIEREIELVRAVGKVPIGMCQGGALALPTYDTLDVAETWVWFNRFDACPTREDAERAIASAKKPVTAYKVFSSPDRAFDLDASVAYIETQPNVRSIVVGVENADQAEETFGRLQDLWP